MNHMRLGIRSFTLVEILVVVSIIGLLAGLAIPAVGGALSSAKRAKVTSMANQIRIAVTQFYTEYGFYPTNKDFDQQGVGRTTAEFSLILTGDSNNSVALSQNPRRLAFLEVPTDFTSNNSVATRGILTPVGYLKGNARSNFFVSVDHDYNGQVRVINNGVATNYDATVHVWFQDNRDSKKTVGTWK
jgi:prepilin-type N-terminal cleavage/methylation domain-containing protein